MNCRHLRSLLSALAVACAIAGQDAAALAAEGADPIQILKAVVPGGEVAEVEPAGWAVSRWTRDSMRFGGAAVEEVPVKPSAIYRAGQTFVVRSADDGRWRLGWAEGPFRIVCSAQSYASAADLAESAGFPGLARAPEGWRVRQVAQLPAECTRLASDGAGKTLFVLASAGDVHQVDVATGAVRPVFKGKDYCGETAVTAIGLTLDTKGRLYVVANVHDSAARPEMNRVTIYRTTATRDGVPADPKPWFKTEHPYGIGVFNHGVSLIAQGPDGKMYVSSGSRTDHGEQGMETTRSHEGETPITACLWRLDPEAENPQIEVVARGLRNAFGFCWDDKGRLFATENGPNADAPEEINLIEQGGHYGFPYQFSTYDRKVYPDQPEMPAGLKVTPPILNTGPDAGGSVCTPLGTLDPHSSPSGIVYLGVEGWPAKDRGTFLVARFGNLIGPKDVGFDVVQVRLADGDGKQRPTKAEVSTFLAPVARPTDLHLAGGRVYVLEYQRQVTNHGMGLPGRVVELAPMGK